MVNGDDKSGPNRSIVAAGQKIDVGVPVVLWTDPNGFNAYAPRSPESPARKEAEKQNKLLSPGFGKRTHGLTAAEIDVVAQKGWDLPLLQKAVDQFVIHYDACGTSQKCFEVLHDERNLSIHFMLDLDGTIYQTLDLQESAWHATTSNGRSIGIEIANIGAFPLAEAQSKRVSTWYPKDAEGKTYLKLPESAIVPGRPDAAERLRPSSNAPVEGTVQGQKLAMYDLTPQQYDSLIKLTAGLCKTFPKIRCELPRDASGKVLDHKIDDATYQSYEGILGHFHIQTNKTDPGPAFQWDRLIRESRERMSK